MDQANSLRTIIKGESGKIHKLKRYSGDGPFSVGGRTKVITITSGKGGVGKTNIVVNLAISLQRMGKKVLIFDADLGLANIDIIFGINPTHTIEEIIRGEKELSQIIVKGPEGVSLIPASSGVMELAHLTEGQKMNLLSEFDTLNDVFDIILIDTGAGISSNVIYFNLGAEERIIVVTSEPTSITDSYALIKIMFYEHGIKNFFLLLNMVKNEREAQSVYQNLSNVISRFMGELTLDYAGFIPQDSSLQKAVSRREPVICSYPEASSSKSFQTLANYLLDHTERKTSDGNIKFLWNSLMVGNEERK